MVAPGIGRLFPDWLMMLGLAATFTFCTTAVTLVGPPTHPVMVAVTVVGVDPVTEYPAPGLVMLRAMIDPSLTMAVAWAVTGVPKKSLGGTGGGNLMRGLMQPEPMELPMLVTVGPGR